ncbi:uncharacterized protein LOC117316608 isoform X2 [Pecten maximus]|uniref:uncharacterized protein LOC117316608 isoform X2 n=1 Tax=Pecten maximus TaxID=6579 RepID=UPI001458C369|nr:uncharacterized protein LOC117316608 isoform X2 [Pecten maximus]
MEEGQEMCCVCARNGKASKLKIYQINFDEAIRFCEDDECTYPAGMDNSSWVLNRKFSELQVSKPSVVKKKSVPVPQQTHQSSIKFPNYNHGAQKKISNSKSPKNLTPVKPTLNTKQGHLKTGQNNNMHTPLASLSKTGQRVISRNKFQMKSESLIPFPALQLSAGKPKPDTATTKQRTGCGQFFKSVTSKKSEKSPDASNSTSAMQTTVDKGDKVCSRTRDHLMAFYPQWQNKDALCWMDVILCLLVHCKQVNKLQSSDQDSETSIVCTLLKAYEQALSLLNKRSISRTSGQPDVDTSVTISDNSKVNSHINSASTLLSEEKLETRFPDEDENHLVTNSVKNEEEVKTGAGLKLLKSDFLKLMTSHSDSEYSKVFDLLGDVREKIWNLLHPRLQCKKGKNDSPVFAIPLLTKNSKDLEHLLSIKYNFHFSCTKCGLQDVRPYQKVLPTFPNTTKNFSMNDPKFIRPCFRCLADGQTMTMVFERLPPVIMLHFQEGLHSNKFSGYDFYHQDQLYQVTGVIQYRNDPDHFIAWIRNPKELWMECNDLKSPICQFDQSSPNFPAGQVHIMMWEAVGPEDCNDVQDSTKMACNRDSVGNGHIEVSMDTSISNENDLMSYVTGKVDNMNSVASYCSSDAVSTPTCLGSLPTQKSINMTPIGDCHLPTVVSETNGTSTAHQVTSAKHTGKVASVLLDQILSRANTQKPGDVKRFQLRNINASALPGDKKGYYGASNFSKSTSVSTHTDKILNKTKDNVTLLRNMRNPRPPQVCNDSRDHPNAANLRCLPGQGSLSFLTRILGNNKSKTTVSPVVKGKVFEGYKSKTFDAAIFTSKSRTKSMSAEVDTESLTSRPNSPALSCHSDSFVIQKRKSELVSENNKLPALKRRRSQDTNFTLVCPQVRMKSLSLDTATSLTKELPISNASSSMNDSIVETAAIGSQCSSNTELLTSAVRNDCTFQESDILQNLYSALNIDMPANTDDSKSPMKAVGTAPVDVENIPDISDLDNFINTSCDSSMEDNFDDFLSEL